MVAQNAELVRRMQRLSPVLVEMASDLAGARRESSALRRENEQLHARLTRLERRIAAIRGCGMLASTPERR
jgi:cell division protein FtsB